MAYWDFIKQLRANQEEEKTRRKQGGFLNSLAGFVDDGLDTAGDVTKKVVGATAGLARETIVRPVAGAIASAEEKQHDYAKEDQLKLLRDLQAVKPQDRAKWIKDNSGMYQSFMNDPKLSDEDKQKWLQDSRYKGLSEGKLEVNDINNTWLFGDTRKNKKATIDISSNESLAAYMKQLEEQDAGNDKGRESTNYVDRQIFGNEPVQAYQNRKAGLEKEAGWSPAMALAGTTANAALDIPVVGTAGKLIKTVGKEGIEQLAKTGTREGVEKLLAGKTSKDIISRISQTIADSTDPKAIKQLLNDADSSIIKRVRTGKTAGELADEAVANNVRKVNSSVMNPANTAIEDANKQALKNEYNPNLVSDFVNTVDPQKLTPEPTTPTFTPRSVATATGRSKEEEDLLGRIHSTSDIEDMKPKKGVKSLINEQTFDKNAPLEVFKETYKRTTGQDLPADFDPKVIMQLSNGNDAAAKLQLAPITQVLSQSKNLDDVRILGAAKHILNRRDTLPAERVAGAEAAIRNMQSRLGSEFNKVDEEVGAVVKFNQDQLQRLADAEIISPESLQYLKEANPDYFGSMALVEHILTDSKAAKTFGASGSHNRARENIIKAVKGFEDDTRFDIRDPIENIARTAATVQKAVKDRELFNAIGEFEKLDPKVAFKQRISENVIKRMNLSLENQDLRPVRDKVERMMKTRERWVKKLQTEMNNFEKQAYQVSLKKGGQQTMPNFTPAGLGGAVPTSKATNKVVAQTPGEEQLMKAMGSPDGMPTPPKLGMKDTNTFLRNLVEGPPSEIARLRKKISVRDVNTHRLLDEIEKMSIEYDDTVQRIVSNSEEAKALMDKELPRGMKAITSMKNGIQERIAVQEEIYDIYAGLNKAQQDVVSGMFKKSMQFTKEMLTTYNPAFALVTNPIRDIAQSAFISKEVPLKDYLLVAPYAKRWIESFVGTLRQDNVFRAVNAAGGGNSGQFVDELDPQKYAEQIMKRSKGARVLGVNSGVVVNNPKDFLKLMAKTSLAVPIGLGKLTKKTGSVIEATTRGVEARAVKARGGTLKEAAIGNRTVSTDFMEGGQSAQVINGFLPFFNARMQGTRNVVKAIKEDPKRAATLITVGIGVPTTTAYLWNATQFKDEYEQVGQDVKDNNFVIFFGKGTNDKGQPNEFITIPKNDIQRFFSNPIENGLKAMRSDDPESFSTMATKMLGGILPIDTVKDGEFNGSRTVGSLTPPVLKGPAQYFTNRNFYSDSPIVPQSMQGLPAEEQVRDTTSGIDKFIAAALPGEQSPLKVNAWRTAMTGNTIRNPVDSLASPLTASANAPTAEFYKTLSKTSPKHDSASKKINEALAEGDYTTARQIATEYNDFLKESFSPWAEKFGDVETPELVDLYYKQKINLTKKSISQRRSNIKKKAAVEASRN